MKHAYLIMAHKDDLTFQTLLKMLDHEENDVFVHFDAKVRAFTREREVQLTNTYLKGRLFFTKRIRTNWGSYSLIKCELLLLKKALDTGRYDYYHLLSGEDLPIQTHKDICDFYSVNDGYQFIGSGPLMDDNGHHDSNRVKYYHFFQERINKTGNKNWRKAEKAIIKAQKILKVDRKKDKAFMRGPQWFSINDELARYIVGQEPCIRKLFKYTFCGDELFIQTIINGTRFEEELFPQGSVRCTDWSRGNPYVWREEDFDTLKEDRRMFARKFDASVDKGIINKVYNQYCL